jgi:hypothetical protein
MQKQHARSVFAVVAVVAWGGCGAEKPFDKTAVGDANVPSMPTPMPGHAVLSGLVLDGNGQPVAGAKISIAETDGSAATDASGAYQITVPSDSTVTLLAAATGFATTYSESVVVAADATVPGFDLMLLGTDAVTSMNALGAPDQTANRGLMALRLHSMDAGCSLDGAHVSVYPPAAAKVVYSAPSTTGGVDQPDPTVDSVQPGASIPVWLTGAVPPGNMLMISVTAAGCQMMGGSPSIAGVVYPGLRHVAAQALTQADLFLTVTQ